MKKSRVTLRILFYMICLAVAAAVAGIIVITYKTKFLLPVLFCFLLFSLFCIYKIHGCLVHRRAFQKGIWQVYDLDDMDGVAFEELTCDILAANGFEIAENTQASVDFGVDVLARKEGMTYAIQCKRYNCPVGIEAVQQVYAGRAYYECHVAVVLTNQYFTSNAKKLADKLGVVLWDRDCLEEFL